MEDDDVLETIFTRKRSRVDIDWHMINAILDNCKASEVTDCKRLLLAQSYDLIEHIYYNLMYDPNTREENDFIPSGCTYDELLIILLSIGGSKETLNQKEEYSVKRIISQYRNLIRRQREIIKKHNAIIEAQESTINANVISSNKHNKKLSKCSTTIYQDAIIPHETQQLDMFTYTY